MQPVDSKNHSPLSISVIRERGRIILHWWTRSGPAPQPFQSNIRNGNVSLTAFEGKQRRLAGNLGRVDRPCWLTFEESNGDRIVRVYEEDRKSIINSFYLVRDKQILKDPEPLEPSDIQLAKKRGQEIVAWWTGEAPIPAPFEAKTTPEGRVHLTTLHDKPRSLIGGLIKNQPCWLVFEED